MPGPVFAQRCARFLALLACLSIGLGTAQAEDAVVNQVTDVMADVEIGLFRFEPHFLRVEPGQLIQFRNSVRSHTVHTVPTIWPEGLEPIALENQLNATVHLDQPGIYGFHCRRHGGHGMVMLIVVGDPGDTSGLPDDIAAARLSVTARDRLLSIAETAGLLTE